MSVTLRVKPSAGEKEFDVTIELEATVADLKEAVASKRQCAPDSIRLVCSGKILAHDESTLNSYDIKEGSSVYCVKNLVKKVVPSASQVLQSVDPVKELAPKPADNASFAERLAHQTLHNDPEMMRKVMEHMLSDCSMLKDIVEKDPQMQQLLEQNPEMAKILDDPEVLDRARKMLLRPDMAKELRRQEDLAIANLDTVQGGQDVLRQALEPMQAAVERAMQNNAACAGVSPGASRSSSGPLANPWAGGAQQGSVPESTSDPAAATELAEKLLADSSLQQGEGMQQFVKGCMENPEEALKEAEKLEAAGVPMQQMVRDHMQQDGVMEQQLEMFLQMRRNQGHNDGPEFIQYMRQRMMQAQGNPAMLQPPPANNATPFSGTSFPGMPPPAGTSPNPMMQMMQQMQQNPTQAGYPSNPMMQMMQQNPTQAGAASNPMMQMMQQMQQNPMMQQMMQQRMQQMMQQQAQPSSPATTATTQTNTQSMSNMPVSDDTLVLLRSKYKNELEDLKSMGFEDERTALIALDRHNGDIEKAVDDLDKDPTKSSVSQEATSTAVTYTYENDEVVAHVYDISGGWAQNSSQTLIGKYMDLLPHTGIVVFGKEYYISAEPTICEPGKSLPSPVKKTIKLGRTTKTVKELDAFLETLKAEWTAEKYNFLTHNSNHYADAVARFLLGEEGLPHELVSLDEQLKSTPMGQQMATSLSGMEANMRPMRGGGSCLTPNGAVFHGGTSSGALANFGGMMGGGAMPPVTDDMRRAQFQSQLAQLKSMGFTDEAQCLRALVQSNGNIDSALNKILAGGA